MADNAKVRYDREHTKQVMLKLNLRTDRDILDKLAQTGNMQGYIKRLIRDDMRGDQNYEA